MGCINSILHAYQYHCAPLYAFTRMYSRRHMIVKMANTIQQYVIPCYLHLLTKYRKSCNGLTDGVKSCPIIYHPFHGSGKI